MKPKESSVTRTKCPLQHSVLSTERQLVRLRIGEIKHSNSKTATDYALKQATTPPLHTLSNSPFQDKPSFQRYTKSVAEKKSLTALKALKHGARFTPQKNRSSHFTIRGARSIQQSTLRTDDTQILGATDSALVARATWDLGLCTTNRNNTKINFLYHKKKPRLCMTKTELLMLLI